MRKRKALNIHGLRFLKLHPSTKKEAEMRTAIPAPFCRDDVTRTRDSYVPNVVRYQLRYIPINRHPLLRKACKFMDFISYEQFFFRKSRQANFYSQVRIFASVIFL